MLQNTADLFRLDNQVAVITGAAGLLGEQHAIALSDLGADLILVDRKRDPCVALAEQIERSGRVRAIGLECDVTQKFSWQEVLSAAERHFGRVDILLNKAAFTTESRSANYAAPFPEFPLEDWNQILAVNLSGTFLGCQVIGEQML